MHCLFAPPYFLVCIFCNSFCNFICAIFADVVAKPPHEVQWLVGMERLFPLPATVAVIGSIDFALIGEDYTYVLAWHLPSFPIL